MGTSVVSPTQLAGSGKSLSVIRARIYRHGVTKRGRDDDADVRSLIAATAERIHKRLGEVSSLIRDSLEDQIPELRGDARIIELLDASVEGNVETLLHALRHDIAVERVEVPTAALEYARRLAQHGGAGNALVRAYRLGQRSLNELVFREVRAAEIGAEERLAMLDAITATLFDYIDWISQQVVVVYEDERERWLENQNSIRALRVGEVLAGKKDVDIDSASTSIRYPLRWHHVALVLWYPDVGAGGDELARLQRFLRELGQAADVGSNPLFVAADETSGWGGLADRSAPPAATETALQFARRRPDCPNVAIGTVASGVDGFRRSHREAAAARSVAVGGGPGGAAGGAG